MAYLRFTPLANHSWTVSKEDRTIATVRLDGDGRFTLNPSEPLDSRDVLGIGAFMEDIEPQS